jgi:dTDP-4-dehydrorhamnose 3,5-epimerase
MEFRETTLPDCLLINAKVARDARGYFSRLYCAEEFHAIDGFAIAQSSISFNAERGTLRGLHFQTPPFMEQKLVRCLRGAIFDVMVDLRQNSTTFGKWFGAELSAENQAALYTPRGFAHGFQTLEPDTLVWYGISPAYQPNRSAGVRWDDPAIAIDWPLTPVSLSPRDNQLPLLHDLDPAKLEVF